MGSGTFNPGAYYAASTTRAASGIDDFAYTSSLYSAPANTWKVSDLLDVKGKERESRDLDGEHPNSTPIVIAFDVTGSMGSVPKTVQAKLPDLMGLLVRGGYVDDPQIAVAGIGDADCDRVPVQFSQFESDNRIDDAIREIFLEGGGGGQQSESYELTAWYVANRVNTDAWEKRGKKGYFFIVGDEMNKNVIRAEYIKGHLGVDVGEHVDVAEMYRQLQERWNVYYILPRMTAYYNDPKIEAHWRKYLGENFFKLEDPAAVCELIATTIGVAEDAITLAEGLDNLSPSASKAVGAVLSNKDLVGAGVSGGAVVDFGGGFDTSGTDEY